MRIDKIKIDVKPTMSSIYFLPFFNEEVKLKFLDKLQNCYVYNNNEDKQFCVLYKFSADREFLKYEEELLDHKLSLGHEDYDEYVLFKFSLPVNICDKLDVLMNHNTNKGLSKFSGDNQRMIVRLARRRLLSNADLIKQKLEGQFKIGDINMEDELFSNHVKRMEIVTANDLYKQAKEAKGI